MKPAYLYAKITEDKHINLKWKWYGSKNDVSGFKIERRSVDIVDFTIIASTPEYFFIDDKIPVDFKASFIYRVHAYKGSIVSGYSNEVRVDIGPEEIAVHPEEPGLYKEVQLSPTGGPEATARKEINPGPTSTPIKKTEPGTVWFVPDSLQVQTGTHFTTGIHINSGKQKVAAFGIVVEFSDAQLDVNRNTGNNGVIPGSDGFVAAVNARDPGILFISGFDTFGKGPGEDLHLLTIQWRALTNGKTNLKLTIRNLNDDKTTTIKNLKTFDCRLSIVDKENVPVPEIAYYDEKWITEPSDDTGMNRIENNSSENNDQPDPSNDGNENSPDPNDQSSDHDHSDHDQPDEYNQPSDYDQPSDHDQPSEYNQPDYNNQPADYYPDDDYDNGEGYPPPDTATSAPDANVTNAPVGTDLPTSKPTQVPVRTNAPTATPVSKKTAVPTATPKKTLAPTATPGKTAPPASGGAGDVWIEPSAQTIHPGSNFETEVHVNTGSQRLATYGINFNFNRDLIDIDKTMGENGVTKGPNGFLAAANSDNPGVLRTAGFDTSGKGPTPDLHLLTIYWKAVSRGNATILMTVKILTDNETLPVGRPNGKNGTIIIE